MSIKPVHLALIERVDADFPDGVPRRREYGYADSLALCAIDSVYSLAARYGAVTNAVNKYREFRGGRDAARTDSLEDLIGAIESVGGGEAAATAIFDNRQVAPGTRRRKAEALEGAARSLVGAGVSTTDDLRQAAQTSDALSAVATLWQAERGLGYASWRYLLMLAGVPGVKIDRMILRYVASVGGSELTKAQIEDAFDAAAQHFNVGTHELDNAVWLKQSGRL